MLARTRMSDFAHDAGSDPGVQDRDDAVQREIKPDQAKLLGAGKAKRQDHRCRGGDGEHRGSDRIGDDVACDRHQPTSMQWSSRRRAAAAQVNLAARARPAAASLARNAASSCTSRISCAKPRDVIHAAAQRRLSADFDQGPAGR